MLCLEVGWLMPPSIHEIKHSASCLMLFPYVRSTSAVEISRLSSSARFLTEHQPYVEHEGCTPIAQTGVHCEVREVFRTIQHSR